VRRRETDLPARVNGNLAFDFGAVALVRLVAGLLIVAGRRLRLVIGQLRGIETAGPGAMRGGALDRFGGRGA